MREDWVEVELGEVCGFVGGGTPSKNNPAFWNGDIPWASIKDIKGENLFCTINFITKEGLKWSSANLALPNEIILATRINPGKPIITKIETAINQDLKIVKPKVEIHIKYLFFSIKNLEKDIIKLSSGTTVLGINLNNLKSIPVPFPPLPIQRAIVSKIETLFSDLDNGITDLKKAQEQLKIYRQAVLSFSFPKKEKIEISKLVTDLSQGWSPKCIRQNSSDITQWAVIKTSAIQAGKFIEFENKILPESLEPRQQHEITKGDILITRAGPRVRVGICCLVRNTRPKLINCDKVYRLRLNTEIVAAEYFEYAMNSPEILSEIEVMKSGSSDSGLNLTQNAFLKLKIPFTSLEKQHQIVREIESRLSVCDKVEESIKEGLEKAEALRQSILKKAFEGKLLSKAEIEKCKQEKDYEPASELLKKIKAEKTKYYLL
ncbi:MAG: restriction endonuclease subunit S [Bacteroidales bacterium]|nr:restriction endonuclease subunit S [Bacteroidales bacterium]